MWQLHRGVNNDIHASLNHPYTEREVMRHSSLEGPQELSCFPSFAFMDCNWLKGIINNEEVGEPGRLNFFKKLGSEKETRRAHTRRLEWFFW